MDGFKGECGWEYLKKKVYISKEIIGTHRMSCARNIKFRKEKYFGDQKLNLNYLSEDHKIIIKGILHQQRSSRKDYNIARALNVILKTKYS